MYVCIPHVNDSQQEFIYISIIKKIKKKLLMQRMRDAIFKRKCNLLYVPYAYGTKYAYGIEHTYNYIYIYI